MSNGETGPDEAHTRLDRTLAAAGATSEASEAHGMLCGLVCLHGSRAGRYWVEAIPGISAAGHPGVHSALAQLALSTAAELEDPAFRFTPLLPADDASLAERAEAIGEWAQGFLYGLGEAGRRPALAAKLEQEPLSELVADLTEITRASVVDDEPGGGDEEEQAYAELVEYLRVATQLFYLELAALRADRHEGSGGVH